jgi:hypothetical protein
MVRGNKLEKTNHLKGVSCMKESACHKPFSKPLIGFRIPARPCQSFDTIWRIPPPDKTP